MLRQYRSARAVAALGLGEVMRAYLEPRCVRLLTPFLDDRTDDLNERASKATHDGARQRAHSYSYTSRRLEGVENLVEIMHDIYGLPGVVALLTQTCEAESY